MSTSNRFSWHAFETDYLDWYHRLHGRHGVAFDPTLFARLARDQWQDEPDLCAAWLRCTMEWPKDDLYTHFMPPMERQHRWNFRASLFLSHPTLGTLVVDVLKDGSIGGMEYLDRVMGMPMDVGAMKETYLSLNAAKRARLAVN